MSKFITQFSDLKVKSKLIVLIFIFTVSLVVLGLFVNFMFRSSQTFIILVNENKVFAKNFDSGIVRFYEYELSGNQNNLDQSINHFNKANTIAYTFAKIDSFMHVMHKSEWIPYFFSVFNEGIDNDINRVEFLGNQINLLARFENKKLKEIQETALNASNLGERIIFLTGEYNANKSAEKLAELQLEFKKVHLLTDTFSSELYALNEYVNKILTILVLLLVLILSVTGTYFAVKISGSISNPINKLAENFKEIAHGNLKSSVNIDSKNEIGEMSKAFLEIQVGLQEIISYSKKVANGDFSSNLTPKSENDELSISLNLMAARLEETKTKNDRERWLQNGISSLDDQMRGNFSVRDLSEKIITYLANFLEVEIGAVYVYDEILEHLELTGSAGLNTEEVKEIIKPGEGLIGKAALHNTLQIINTKNKFHKIFSATGEIIPEKIYLLPMRYDNRMQAVIELAPVNELSELKIEFLQLTTERISVNLGAAVARYRRKELLDKTLEQAEKLNVREEQLSKELDENKRIQEIITREKALLDAMLHALPDYIYFKDINSKFLRISESMTHLFGVNSTSEIIGKSDFEFHSPYDAKRYFDEEQEIIAKGEGFVDEVRKGVDENNKELWTSVTKLPMYDDTGKCIGTFGISKDITQIKKLEIEIKSQNDLLITNQEKLTNTIEKMNKIQSELEREKTLMDSLLNNLPDAVYFKDKESKFIKVSNSMPKLFNLEKPDELYGKSDFDFFEEEHALPAFKIEQEIIKTKKPVIGIVEKETFKNGLVRYVSSTKMPLLNEKGEVTGTFGISRDITKIKELELEVKERNEKLNAQQEELKAINDQLKIQEEELKASNEELKSQEEELRVANEELAEQTQILTENEKNLQAQKEKLHEINKELKLASQYKSEFLANMSHELRTPLNSLLILSNLLSKNKNGNLTEDQVKSIHIIYKSGKDLLELINEILDLSKIEAGKMNFDFSETQIEQISTEIIQNFKPVAENKGLTLEVNKSDDFPAIIYTDKQRLLQIIKNLLSNAFKFTSSGGIKVNMGLTSSEVKLLNAELNSSNTCYISVEDSGIGIPKSKLNAIFEAFHQADGSISRKYGGTGLGLSISKQLTQVLGGEIHVKSIENEGSVFTLYLPLDKNLVGKGQTETVENKNKSAGNKKNQGRIENIKIDDIPFYVDDDRNLKNQQLVVLIIHNEKEKAKILVELCHKRKLNAVAAPNINDGIKLAVKYSPQAIIISAELNDPSGLKNLNDNKFTNRLPLHLVSRIEDSIFDDLEELRTSESAHLQDNSKYFENKIGTEYRQVLVVEDDPVTRQSIHALFENKEIIIHEAKTGQQAFDMISTQQFDCIILDLGLPDFSGNVLLKKLK
ncbi:MAG: ATP-binding protein, partial [Draconibacterium sp.]|nr:ATP-binding protein [Draconibacterium sp.]